MSKWCNHYNMWCSDVEDNLEDCVECDLECESCDDMEVIEPHN